jgi:hypothetical protein
LMHFSCLANFCSKRPILLLPVQYWKMRTANVDDGAPKRIFIIQRTKFHKKIP